MYTAENIWVHLLSGLTIIAFIYHTDSFADPSVKSGNRPITIKDQKNFLEEMALIPPTTLSVFYYSQPSCGPCKQIAPIFIQLCQKYQDVKFIRVDIEKCPEIGKSHNVTNIPSFILSRNRTLLDRVTGTNMNNLEDRIKQYTI